eukprot:gene7897-5522_t
MRRLEDTGGGVSPGTFSLGTAILSNLKRLRTGSPQSSLSAARDGGVRQPQGRAGAHLCVCGLQPQRQIRCEEAWVLLVLRGVPWRPPPRASAACGASWLSSFGVPLFLCHKKLAFCHGDPSSSLGFGSGMKIGALPGMRPFVDRLRMAPLGFLLKLSIGGLGASHLSPPLFFPGMKMGGGGVWGPVFFNGAWGLRAAATTNRVPAPCGEPEKSRVFDFRLQLGGGWPTAHAKRGGQAFLRRQSGMPVPHPQRLAPYLPKASRAPAVCCHSTIW